LRQCLIHRIRGGDYCKPQASGPEEEAAVCLF
jgi:hypothetical protein